MTDKRHDDRDIDEILASIDEMLSQKEPYGIKSDERKTLVEEGIKASKAELSLSSGNQEQEALDDADIDRFLTLGMDDIANEHDDALTNPQHHDVSAEHDTAGNKPEGRQQAEDAEGNKEKVIPRQRILLTEALLEPSAQEALPLWVAQDEENGKDDTMQADSSHDKLPHIGQTQQGKAKKARKEARTQANDNTRQTSLKVEETLGTDAMRKQDPADDIADEHGELLEPMMQEVLEQHKEDEQQEPQTPKPEVLLTPDELDDLARAVSDDVSKQVNDHLQTWLPGLVSIAIKKHLDKQQNKK